MNCKHDSGSMYGNVPLCDRPATWKIDYHNGTYVLVTYACDQHRRVTEARVYPGHDRTTQLEAK